MSAGSSSNRFSWRLVTICGDGSDPALFKVDRLFWAVCCGAGVAVANWECNTQERTTMLSVIAVIAVGWTMGSLDASRLEEQRSMKLSASSCLASFNQPQWRRPSWPAQKKSANETRWSRH